MREIKFRAWDNFYKRFTQYMIESYDNGKVKILFKTTNNNYSDWEISENKNRFKLMQYTGRKDKNYIDIYEVDVIEYNFGGHRYRGLVKYSDDNAMFEIKDGAFRNNLGFALDIEVIGNIYENKELLSED